MVTASWTMRARSSSLAGGAIINDWSGTLVERWNLPDTLQVNGRVDDLWPLYQSAPGVDDFTGGVSLFDGSGCRFSGLISQVAEKGNRTVSITFESDLVRLWERICYPTPSRAITAQTVDYGDTRSGFAETVLLGYINDNLGPGAYFTRRAPHLAIPSSQGRGLPISVTARLDVLGQLVQAIAEPSALRVNVVQDSTDLLVQVTPAPDLRASARYGTADSGGPGLVSEDWSLTISKPDVTVAEIAGGGEGTERLFREQLDVDAIARWGGRRIEQLVDQRQTLDITELDAAGVDALAQGSQPVEITATVLDSPDLRLGVDVPVGALVSLDLGQRLLQDRLRELTTTITADSGSPTFSVTGVVGSSAAGLTRTQKELLAMRRTLRKVAAQ